MSLSTAQIYKEALNAYLSRNTRRFSTLLNKLPDESSEKALLLFRNSFLSSDYQSSSKLLMKIDFLLRQNPRADDHHLKLMGDYHFLKARYRYLMEDTSRKDFLRAENFYKLCRDYDFALRAALNALLELRENNRFDEHDTSLARIKASYSMLDLQETQLFFIHHYETQYLFDQRRFKDIVQLRSRNKQNNDLKGSESRSAILNELYSCASFIEESKPEEAQALLASLNQKSILDEDLLETIKFLSVFHLARIEKKPVQRSWIKNLLAESFRDYSEETLILNAPPKAAKKSNSLSQQLNALLEMIKNKEQSKETLIENLFLADPTDIKAEHRLYNLVYRLRKLHPHNVIKTTYGYRWTP